MEKRRIQPCIMEHVGRYAQIYAAAFSGEPWNDSWTVEDAEVHVQEHVWEKVEVERMNVVIPKM